MPISSWSGSSVAPHSTTSGRIGAWNTPVTQTLNKVLPIAKAQEQQQLKQHFQNPAQISTTPELKDALQTGSVTKPQFLSRFAQLQNAPTKMNKYSVGNIAGAVAGGVGDTAKGIGEAAVNTVKAPLNLAPLAKNEITGNNKGITKSTQSLNKSALNSFIGPFAQTAKVAGATLAARNLLNKNTSPEVKNAQLKQDVNPALNTAGFDLGDKGARQKLKEAGLVAQDAAIPILSKGGMKALEGKSAALDAIKEPSPVLPKESPDLANSSVKPKTPEISAGKGSVQNTNAYQKHYTPGSDHPDEQFAHQHISGNVDQALNKYDQITKEKFGATNVVSGDEAKYVIPKMGATKSANYHEPASALAKVKYDQLLNDSATKDKPVLLNAGGSGAGKTHGLKATGHDVKDFAAVVDTNSNKLGSATSKIDQALQSGRQVEVNYTHRDVLDAFKNGVMPRAKSEGRIVPIESHLDTHFGAHEVIPQLVEKYKDNPNVNFTLIDNHLGPALPTRLAEIDKLPKMGYDRGSVRDILRKEVDNAKQRGEITPEEHQTYVEGSKTGSPSPESNPINGESNKLSKSAGQSQGKFDAEHSTVSPKKLNLGEKGSVAPGQAPNEEGAVAPAKMVSDIKDFTAKRQAVKTTGKNTSDKLFKLTQENKADTDKATAILKDTKAATPADWEAVYHYREDPSSPVTPFQKALHDQVIKPLYDSVSSKDESANYQHRINIDKRGPVQSLLKGKFKGMGSNLLRQTTDSEKQRSMKVLTDDQGNRTVVHIGTPKNDLGKVSGAKKVTAFNDKKPTVLGPYKNEKGSAVVKNGDKFTAKNGKTYTVGEATTKEIEQHTNVKYSHNSLANALDHVLKTKSATRAKQFLEDWKTSPEFKQIARSVNDSDIPDHYVPTQAAQFRGYVFEPKIAHHLDDFAGNYAKDPLQAITGLNKFVTTTIFMNPIVHLPNEIFFGLFNRGLSRNIPGLGAGKGAKALGKAFTGVIKNSKDYEAAQRAGMPTMSRGSEAYQRVLQKTIGKQLQDPNIETRLIKAGISSPKRLASAWMHSVHTLTWMTQDVINYQAVLESEARGMSRAEAIDKNFTHGTGTIPDYRKPTTILGSRNAQQVITNPNISVFTTYHLNALKSFMNTGKTLIARDATIKDKATALDRLAMLGVLSIALSAGADKLARSVTGNPNAEVRRPGPLTIPTAVVKAAEGKIGMGRLATDIVTPPPGTKTALQLGNNKDQYGNQIFKPSEIKSNPKQAATDAGKFAAGAISPFQIGQRAAKNPSKTLASILGISQPQSDTNNKVYNLLGQQLGSSGMSVDVQRTNAQKNSARQQIASGKGDSQARDLVTKGVLTKQGLTDFKIKAKWTPLQRAFDSLSPANKLDVLNSSKPGEMNGLIVNKHNLLLSLSNTAQSKTAKPETKIAANQLIKKLGGNQGSLYLQYKAQQRQKHFLTRFAR